MIHGVTCYNINTETIVQSSLTSDQLTARNELLNDAYSHLKTRVIHYAAETKI